MVDFDIAIVGGGLNGACLARDAAGRGLRVLLLEQNDLGSGAAISSPHLMHGDFIDLEHGSALRVRSALAERDIALRNTPHLVISTRFILPVHEQERPHAMLKAGLYVYDQLSRNAELPAPETLDMTTHPMGHPLKRAFGAAFAFSDCLVDETRLVVLNARDAAEHGASVRTGARCARADRSDVWRLAVIDRGRREVITARALVNAAGASSFDLAETVLHLPGVQASFMRVSQIVVKRLFDHDNVYVFQNDDGRLVYAIPFEREFTLIGACDQELPENPGIVSATASDISYLCAAVNRYLRERMEPSDVVHAMAGVNLRVAGTAKSRWRRDGYMKLDRKSGQAPLLTMFGGTTTTARRRAEVAFARLASFFKAGPSWTATAALPGGDFSWLARDEQIVQARARWPFLRQDHASRLIAAYGTRIANVLGPAKSMNDLGPLFGDDLTATEVRYLMREEWARFPDDILWRRSKLGLTMSRQDRDALADFMTDAGKQDSVLSA